MESAQPFNFVIRSTGNGVRNWNWIIGHHWLNSKIMNRRIDLFASKLIHGGYFWILKIKSPPIDQFLFQILKFVA